MSNPKCPICGAEMKQTGRGITRRNQEPSYRCPVEKSELYEDENGHRKRKPGAKHNAARVWFEYELKKEGDQSREL